MFCTLEVFEIKKKKSNSSILHSLFFFMLNKLTGKKKNNIFTYHYIKFQNSEIVKKLGSTLSFRANGGGGSLARVCLPRKKKILLLPKNDEKIGPDAFVEYPCALLCHNYNNETIAGRGPVTVFFAVLLRRRRRAETYAPVIIVIINVRRNRPSMTTRAK